MTSKLGAVFIIILLTFLSIQSNAQKAGLKFDGIIYVTDSVKVCPDGYIWEIQSLLTRDETLKTIPPKAKDEPEETYLFRVNMKLKAIWIGGGWFYPSSFPFNVAARTQVSSGDPKNFVVIAQYKIE